MIIETVKEEQSIKQVIEKFTETWNIHDSKAFSLLFAEDADFTNVFGQRAHGRTGIEKIHASIFATMFKESNLSSQETDVRFLNQNLAAVDVIWNMSAATDPQGKPWPDRKGLMNLIMKNDEESWKILIMHNMDFPVTSLK